LRWQQALGRRTVLRADAFASDHESRGSELGTRVELLIKF
jgi:hypothetical protein